MDFEKLISERFSVRSFKPQPLPKPVLESILNAARQAPTGCNYQPQRILVLNSEAALEKLKACTKCHFNAPAALLVCYDRDESWKRPYDGVLSCPVDAAIVSTYLMLAAQNAGVGCCYVMHFNPTAMREAFAIPENIEPLALLALGYPAEEAKPLPMHFERKPLTETVFYESFEA